MKFRKVAVGGTFDYLHRGHMALILKAFEVGENVVIGVTSDEMQELLRKDSAGVQPLAVRLWNLLDFLRGKDLLSRTQIVILTDRFGPAASARDIEAIVVSPATRGTAEEINRIRGEKKLPPLEIIEVPFVLAEDGTPISSIKIRYGEMDVSGKILKPSKIQPSV
ncbi:MAG: pantetheine-phosphate adenylyltransferase [Candidatus Hadarchaeales archaeon]